MNVKSDWTSDLPYSYGGKFRSYNAYPDVDKKKIDEEFKNIDIYSRFKPFRKLRHFTPTYVYRKRELFQADTVHFKDKSYVEANNGYQYLICIIDCFTKKAWAYPTKNITCETAINCLQDLFSKLDKLPEKLATDKGSEFKCHAMKKFLMEKEIKHYFTQTERKAAMVERFQLTIQLLLNKLMRQYRHKRWVELLPTAMKIYNNRIHSFIKMSPEEGEKEENQLKIRKEYYKKYLKAEKYKVKPKFEVGDTVRIWNHRTIMSRGYHENYTMEWYIITHVLTGHPNPRYKIKDIMGEEIIGIFFQNELVAFNPDAEPYYEIEEILKERGKGKNKQYFVKFYGWDKKFNDWVYATDVD